MSQLTRTYAIRLQVDGAGQVTAILGQVGVQGEASFKKIENAGGKTSVAVGALATKLKALASITSLALVARSVLTITQQYEKIDLRLKNLTSSSQDYAQVQDYLKTKAQELNVDLRTLSDGYARLLTLQKAGLIDRNQVNAISEGLVNAAAALGAAAPDLERVLFGLSQGLSSGTLRAEELNQVVEPLPGLLQELDRAAGLPSGGFRRMVNDGKVTADFFSTTLIKALDAYKGSAEGMTDTVTGSFTRLNNSWQILAYTIGQSVIIDALIDLTDAATQMVSALDAAANGNHRYLESANLLQTIAFRVAHGIKVAFLGLSEIILEVAEAALRDLNDISVSVQQTLMDFGVLKRKTAVGGLEEPLYAVHKTHAKIRSYIQDDINSIRAAQSPEQPDTVLANAVNTLATPPTKSTTAAMDKQRESIEKVTKALQLRNDQILRSKEEQELYNQLQQAGVTLDSQQGQQIRTLVDEYFRLSEVLEKNKKAAERLKGAADGVGQAFSSAFEQIAIDGGSLSDVLGDLLKQIERVMFQRFVGDPIADAISGIASNIFSGIGFGSTGARASGGAVVSGQSYLVGENGPEYFTPHDSGIVHPNRAGGVNVTVINNSPSRVSVAESDKGGTPDIQVMIDEAVAQNISQSGSRTRRALNQYANQGIVRR